jgi:hypothetical protein
MRSDVFPTGLTGLTGLTRLALHRHDFHNSYFIIPFTAMIPVTPVREPRMALP